MRILLEMIIPDEPTVPPTVHMWDVTKAPALVPLDVYEPMDAGPLGGMLAAAFAGGGLS